VRHKCTHDGPDGIDAHDYGTHFELDRPADGQVQPAAPNLPDAFLNQ
jgi:hypothetical protein